MDELIWTPDTARLDSFDLWARNPKTMSKARAARLRKSWEEMGQYQTLACGPSGECYDGHQRVKTLQAAGYAGDYLIAVRRSNRPLTEDERERVIIESTVGTVGALNWQEMAGWDTSALIERGLDTEALTTWNADAAELYAMLTAEKDAPPDDLGAQVDRAEELREKFGVEVGQLWQLGEHRVICGDCTVAAVVARVMDGEKARAVVTDPPYGINLNTDLSAIETDWKGWKGQGGKYSPIIGDDKPFDPSTLFRDFGDCEEMFIWGADYFVESIPNCIDGSWLVWDKRINEQGKNALTWSLGSDFELCWSKARHKREVIRKLWSGLYGTETQDVRSRVHPTQKPVEVIEWILKKYTEQGAVIVDPFLGSGTTLIVCERLGRKCRGVEISPAYVAVTIQRWVDMTGGEPVLLTQ